ncbi:MAG: homoserine kinase [Elusimicrobia bacterium]|jgi:homoserine kinase|nr:homoserine kinase [Elusimicrobiota bacterium]MBK7545075.1 homoserine kinase [Elusimicrobiota bacterium]MBK7574594.1 homoserine kinase [Elusimicrobiota bacterium]MBK7688038.1 homoserine kinase [Elusimicrobiota bacterium]MBK8126741.1 homoserine kinase [Elusimicrobiota bacterium]
MTSKLFFSVTVRVPASSANMGPGFDALGIALSLHDEWTVRGGDFPTPLGIDTGGSVGVPTNGTNLAYRAFRRVFAMRRRALPALRFTLKSALPVAGGLGSSSAAIVGGLVAANAVLGRPLSSDALLDEAAAFEGHPDNVAPALLGGFCSAVIVGKNVRCVARTDPRIFRGLVAVVVTPDFALKTEKARAVLPVRVRRADAVFNTGRAALLASALLSGRRDLLAVAMDDRLHQPYRKALIPGFAGVLKSATAAGAHGAALSGAGPTILALAPASRGAAVGRAMERAFGRARVRATAKILSIDTRGAVVSSLRKASIA